MSHGRLRLHPGPMGRAEVVASVTAAQQMGARGRVRCHHLRVSANAWLADAVWVGTRDGVDFEIPDLMVGPHDGRRCHCARRSGERHGPHDRQRVLHPPRQHHRPAVLAQTPPVPFWATVNPPQRC